MQVLLTMAYKKHNQIYEILRQKADEERAAVAKKAKLEVEKAKLKLGLIRKNSTLGLWLLLLPLPLPLRRSAGLKERRGGRGQYYR